VTEDPVKLFVIVMTILLAVLGLVTMSSYSQAKAYELALARAPRDAENLREYAADVNLFCEQLKGSKLRDTKSPLGLIEEIAKSNGFRPTGLRQDPRLKPVSGSVKERRFIVELTRAQGTEPLPRDLIGKFCRDVELYSNGLLKTIEVDLLRATGPRTVEVGKLDDVVGDTYTFEVVFGHRFIE